MTRRLSGVLSAAVLAWLITGCGSAKTKPDDNVWTPRPANKAKKADATAAAGTQPRMVDKTSAGASNAGKKPVAAKRTPDAGKSPGRSAKPAARRDGMTWVSRALPSGDRNTSALLIEHGVPSEVAVNAPYSYVIKVTNLTAHGLEGVVVTDEGKGQYRVASSSPAGATAGGTTTWKLGTLGPRESRTITVNAAATGVVDIVHSIDVDYSSVLRSRTRVVRPALKLVAEGTPAALASDPVVYKFTVSNSGNGVARGVKVRSQLPQGLMTVAGKSSVEFNAGNLGAGQSKSFTIRTKAQRGNYSVGATATGAGLTASSNKVATKVTSAELQLRHSGPSKAFFGRNVAYKLTVKNAGDGACKDAVLTVPMATGAAFNGASGGGRLKNGTLTWKIGVLRPGQSRSFEYRLNTGRTRQISSKATVSAYGMASKSAPILTKVAGIPAILMEVVDLEDPIEVGSSVTYRVTITNQGTAPGHNIRIQCTLESSMQLMAARGATKHKMSGMIVNFDPVRSLAPKEKASWNLVVRAKTAGDVRFTVKMTSDELQRPVAETEATHFYK